MAAEKRASLTWRSNRSNRTRRTVSRKDAKFQRRRESRVPLCASTWTLRLGV